MDNHAEKLSSNANSWDGVRAHPSAQALQVILPLDVDTRRKPWEKFHKVNEKESTHFVGKDMRLLGGRVAAF